MNLRDLQYLTAVADSLHFGKAAEHCHVSQPTLSMQLKKLEDTLGVQLFERSNKHVMLTPIGRDIAARARTVLKEAQGIRELARHARDPLAGEIKLGIFPTLAPYILPTLAPLLRETFPRLNVLLVEEKTPVLIRQLEEGDLDFAILAMPVESAQLTHEALFTEPFMHRLAKRKSVSFADIHGETMLLLEDGHCLREQALEVCSWAGVGEAQNFRATSLETLRHMVAVGGSVTLIPELAAEQKDAHLRYIPFKDRNGAPARKLGLYMRKTGARAALFTAMAEAVVGHYQSR